MANKTTDGHVVQFYDAIIERVLLELDPKLEEEGIDKQIIDSIKQLWKEKLATSFEVGGSAYGGGAATDYRQGGPPTDYRGGGQMRAPAGAVDFGSIAHHQYGAGIPGLDGHHMPRQGLPHGSDVLLGGVRVKAEGYLPQTDGAVEQDDRSIDCSAPGFEYPFECPAATAARRKPRIGDEVFLDMTFGNSPCDEVQGIVEALSQLDGFGGGPKRRKTTESGAYDEDLADDVDDDGGDGGGGNEEEELNSDDDDEDDLSGERPTEHVILCQFEKVTRQKQKWKAQANDAS